MSEPPRRTIAEAGEAIRAGALTATELVEDSLRAAEVRSDLNAIAHLDADGARRTAADLDDQAASGTIKGPLHGIPVTIKDLFVVDGMPTGCGAGPDFPSIGDTEATAVTRLRDAGAVILGKANLHEVAYGITGENAWTGDVCNPHDPSRQSGGSSSGSAVAVAAGIGLASLGTDTGGSIRAPASHSGIVGFKPTHGRVPLDGALELSRTCDHAGPLTRTVADAALVTAVLAGDEPTALEPVRPQRLGVPLAHLDGALSRPVRHAFEGCLDVLRRQDVDIVDVDLPGIEESLRTFVDIQAVEASRVHERTLRDAPGSLSPAIRDLLAIGELITPEAEAASRERREEMAGAFDDAIGRVDALVLPASPVPPPRRGTVEVELESGPEAVRMAIIHLTLPFSLTGLPVTVIPAMLIDGLPVGLQVVGPRGRDDHVLAVAAQLERAC